MSGGRLNYYCTADVVNRASDAKSVVDWLKEHHCENTRAYLDAKYLLILLYEAYKLHQSLYNVNHDIEWAMSGDIYDSDAIETAKNYIRNET